MYEGWTVVRFPARLCVHRDSGRLSRELIDWLESQVGSRRESWNYPDLGHLSFQCPRHATLFKLTWCGQ